MNPNELTLRELSERVGIEPRTIRSYIQQGLLRGPDGHGPKASYGDYHLRRLRAIRTLREAEGKSLAEIRMLLVAASEDEIAELAARSSEAPEGGAPSVTGSNSALDYLRAVKTAMGGDWAGTAPRRSAAALPVRAPASADRRSPLEQAVEHLSGIAGGRPAPRKSRGEPWFRIPVLPDVELSIRGARSPEELAQFERLADLLRNILMGGHDGPEKKP